MKAAIAILMTLACVSAMPQTLSEKELRQERLITDTILGLIDNIRERIVEAGLDPYELDRAEGEFALSEPVIFSATAFAESVRFTGLSNIVVHNINFGILTSRLTLDVSLPRIELTVGNAVADVTFFGRELHASGSGRLAIVSPRINGDVRITIGIITGITVRDLNVSFRLGGIESDLNVNILGNDISEFVNTFAAETVPEVLNESSAAINDLIEYIAWIIIENILDSLSI